MATRRSWSSRTPTSTPPSRARCWRRCATSARPAPPRTASTCTSRVAEEFAAGWPSGWARCKIGRGTDDGVEVGPLIDDDQRAKVAELVDDAVGKGATLLAGGVGREGAGYFYEPTVLDRRPRDARVLSEEIFGPVAPIATFTTDDEAIAAANDTEFGLVSYVFTRRPQARPACLRGARDRDDRPQPGHRLQRRRAVRWRQAVRLGREGGNEGIASTWRRSTSRSTSEPRHARRAET